MIRNIILFLIGASSCYGSCNKFDCAQTSYSFDIYVKAIPDNDSINVNDTIWFELNESVELHEKNLNKKINYSNAANLGFVMGFDELTGNSNNRSAASDFTFVLKNGKETSNLNPLLFREFLFEEMNYKYIFKLGVIPKKKGIYRIGISDANNVFTKDDKCTKAFFKVRFKETSQHLYFNNNNFGVITPSTSTIYCFSVK